MASTYSSLKIELIGTGDQSGTWGVTTNTNLGTAIEEAITGSADVAFSSADVTLTLSNTNASQTARNLRLNLTGTTGGSTRNLIVPNIEKFYIVTNGCADSVIVKNSTGTGVTVLAGKTALVFNDAANVLDAVTQLNSPTLVTPVLGTPSSGNFSSGTFTWPTFNQNTTGQAGSVANALTAGTSISFSSGSTYNGSAAITINNSAPMVYPGAGIPNSTGSAWGTSYTTSGSGTVVALATGASLTTPTINTAASVGGTWTAAATWTLPAHTLGGTISGGGNNINNVVIGAVSPGAGTFSSLSDSGNLTFTGTSNRILGDFTNATIANRVAFQTSTADSNTVVGALPNGTATGSALQAYNNSAPLNSSLASLEASSTAVTFASSIRGTGTYLPISFNVSGSETMRLLTTGAVSFGASGTAYGTSGQVLTSGGASASPTWSNAAAGTVTSVGFTGGLITVATATTTPALTVAGTSGGIVYFSSASTWASSAALAASAIVLGGGAGAAPATTTTGAGVVTALGVATNGSGGFITDTGTVTLTNKTLTNPTITNYTETVNALGTGSSFSPALTSGTVITLTTNANTTITLPTSTAGKSYIIIINYGGVHTLTWAGGSTIKWVNGTTPTATSVSGKYDIFSFFCDGTNTYAQTVGLNY